jgi:hypothetical protein
MIKDSPSSSSITEQAKATHKVMKKVRRLYAEQQVNDALAMRNRLNIELLLALPLQSDIQV